MVSELTLKFVSVGLYFLSFLFVFLFLKLLEDSDRDHNAMRFACSLIGSICLFSICVISYMYKTVDEDYSVHQNVLLPVETWLGYFSIIMLNGLVHMKGVNDKEDWLYNYSVRCTKFFVVVSTLSVLIAMIPHMSKGTNLRFLNIVVFVAFYASVYKWSVTPTSEKTWYIPFFATVLLFGISINSIFFYDWEEHTEWGKVGPPEEFLLAMVNGLILGCSVFVWARRKNSPSSYEMLG